jgi:hypothetical protein
METTSAPLKAAASRKIRIVVKRLRKQQVVVFVGSEVNGNHAPGMELEGDEQGRDLRPTRTGADFYSS